MDQAIAIAPYLLTRPKLGRIPDMPHQEVGQIIDPRVSEPRAHGAKPDATIAPDPLDEPHVQQSVFHGFLQGPVSDALPFE